MGPTLRAARSLILIAGFYLLGVALLALLLAVDRAAVLWTPAGIYGKVVIVSVVLAVPVVRGMFMLRVPEPSRTPGVEVGEADQPELWAVVRETAAAVGTRGPVSLVLTAEVNAAVAEESRLGGLLPGRRRMEIGIPLLTGLGEAQLRAVIAHEFGHYANSDTRLAGLQYRGQRQIARTIEHFHERAEAKADKERSKHEAKAAKRAARGKETAEADHSRAGITYRAMARIYTWYFRFFVRASLKGNRRQEYAADLAAARIAGRDATAAALRELPALDAAFDFYLDRYAAMGLPHGLRPPRGALVGDFGHFLSARELELAGIRSELPETPASPYDSHPPLAERVRRIEALAADGRGDEGRGAATALLRAPQALAAGLEDAVFGPRTRALPCAEDWDDYLARSMAAQFAAAGSPARRALTVYTKEPSTLDTFLKVVDDGQLWNFAQRMPKSDAAAAATGRAFREFVRPELEGLAHELVMAELGSRGLIRWEFSWAEPATAHPLSDGLTDGLEAAIASLVADRPDTAPLRLLLAPA
ncbi:M48 family metalloprotease [Streptomyces sp. NPDC060194]|uniref:M48 family metallopeptidase n=1 Tax=Streptomyces sp. NPDC060194 TaxID=3347069 RepID=UPI0036623DCD